MSAPAQDPTQWPYCVVRVRPEPDADPVYQAVSPISTYRSHAPGCVNHVGIEAIKRFSFLREASRRRKDDRQTRR